VKRAPANEDSALERAELLVRRLEDDAERIARSVVARAVELAEDVWAEAQSVRGQGPGES
jgi:hypothetical protein